MGVNPTPSNFKTFTFDNTNSAQYGVYITGEGVFNAPERNVEMIGIPGRNGAYALDKGSFNNIEVTYPAGIVADTEADFAKAVSDLRNFLCSKNGYCRLTDDYNSGEYRMAIYKSGLEVSHEGLLTGEFDITFECKPQRFLTSGETKQTLTSGNAITNPTLFPSKPQLQVYGYGDIDIGGQTVKVQNGGVIGEIILMQSEFFTYSPITITVDTQYANSADVISIQSVGVQAQWDIDSGYWTGLTASATGNGVTSGSQYSNRNMWPDLTMRFITFAYGTPSTETTTGTYSVTSSQYGADTGTITLTVAYYGDDTFTVSFSATPPSHLNRSGIGGDAYLIKLNSTQSTLGNPMYIDLDIGEAYKVENGLAVSVNNAVSLPAELPTLPSGATTITFDNTFTKVDIVPRWWKV